MGNVCAHAYPWISLFVAVSSRTATASKGIIKKEEQKNLPCVTMNAAHAANADVVSILHNGCTCYFVIFSHFSSYLLLLVVSFFVDGLHSTIHLILEKCVCAS